MPKIKIYGLEVRQTTAWESKTVIISGKD